MPPTYSYLGNTLEPFVVGFHPDVKWPQDPQTKEPLVCPLGYAPMVWPADKKGVRAVYFHWPLQLEETDEAPQS